MRRLFLLFLILTMVVLFASCRKQQDTYAPDDAASSSTAPTIEINAEGYWVINGVKTDYKAEVSDGENGKDGITPDFKIENGNLMISYDKGVTWTSLGEMKNENGEDEATTVEINSDGYWVINGVVTEYKVCTCDDCEHNYTETVVPPTCGDKGYTEHLCSKCGNFYIDAVTSESNIHTYEAIYVLESTCISCKVLNSCTVCNKVTIFEQTPTAAHNYEGDFCIVCDNKRPYERDGQYIYFGEYPQTIKLESVSVTSTIDSRGYYLGSDGEYYAAVTADPYASNYTFTNNAAVVSGTVYYFKVEPIRWRILSEENGEAFVLCDSIIANMAYQPDYTYDNAYAYTSANGAPSGTYANNYKYSEVRRWLNDNFYNTAFSDKEREIILTTEIDNSKKSANPSGNETY